MKNTHILLIMNFLSGMACSIYAPLFPILGKKIGIKETIIGLVISTFSLSNFCVTSFVPSLIKKFKRTRLLYLATFCEASCTLLYGFLYFIPLYNTYILIISSIILRMIHGACSGIIFTLLYSITNCLADEKEVEKSLGNLEIGWSFGELATPICISFFYDIGGYSLPFIVLGLCLYISVYLSSLIASFNIDSDSEKSTKNPPLFRFLIKPDFLTILLISMCGVINNTFCDPNLTNFLVKEYGLSVSISSLFFLIPVVTYVIPIQFIDVITSKIGFYLTIGTGFFIMSVSSFLIHPIFKGLKSIISIIIGLSLNGIGSVSTFIPIFVILTKKILKAESNIDELTAGDFTGSMLNLVYGIGAFIGPIIGGFLTSHFGFDYCCFFITIIVISGLFWYFYYFHDNVYYEIKKFFKLKHKNKNIIKKISHSIDYIERKYSKSRKNSEWSRSSLFTSLTD